MMLILCYASGVGWGVFVIFFHQEEKGAQFSNYYNLMLCLAFGQYATVNVHFYRVWLLYYKQKLQNDFGRGTRHQGIFNENIFLTSSCTWLEKFNEKEQKENLLKGTKPESIDTSFIVRNKHILGRSIMNKMIWLFLWICECFIAFSTFRSRNQNKPIQRWSPNVLANEMCGIFPQIFCLVVLFFFPSDNIFRIKIELRLIFFITTVKMVLYYILLSQIGKCAAYLNLSIAAFAIMVAITSSNWRAVQIQCCCIYIFRQQRKFHQFDSTSESVVTMMDILKCECLFQAFQRHLKREFSLENLNFIVNVVQYRRLSEEHINPNDNNTDLYSSSKKTAQKRQEISPQPITVTIIPTLRKTCISSTSASRCGCPLPLGTYSEIGNSSSNCKSPRILYNKQELGKKNTRQITWIKSEINFIADKYEAGLFIFEEYCAGAPHKRPI
jgi:hypothetical protein